MKWPRAGISARAMLARTEAGVISGGPAKLILDSEESDIRAVQFAANAHVSDGRGNVSLTRRALDFAKCVRRPNVFGQSGGGRPQPSPP